MEKELANAVFYVAAQEDVNVLVKQVLIDEARHVITVRILSSSRLGVLSSQFYEMIFPINWGFHWSVLQFVSYTVRCAMRVSTYKLAFYVSY